jgi:putative exosortase-associated protein (TIGR04073 family)
MRSAALAVALSLVLASPAYAAERAYPVKITWKLFRGVANVLLAPVELPVNSYKEAKRAGLSGGSFGDVQVGGATGLVTGLGYAVARMGVGAFDIVSFPLPTEPVMHPDVPLLFFEVLSYGDEHTSILREAPDAHTERLP